MQTINGEKQENVCTKIATWLAAIIKTESCFDSKGACSSCIQQKTRQRALSDDRAIAGSLRSLKLTLSTLSSAIKPVRSCSLHFLIHAAQVLLLFLSLRVTGCIW